MARYSVSHNTPVGSDLDIINLTGAATIRCKLYDMILGSDAGPADNANQYELARSTSVGSGGSALTEAPLDPLTVAATASALGGTFSAGPTEGNVLLEFGLNQRATFRWVAAPGSELISAATANNGLMLSTRGSSAYAISATFLWEE